jgi:hypothetical protein
MRLRGKVLRALGAGPGLVIIEGRQYRFTATAWHSAAKLLPGMEVEAVLDSTHRITEIVLAREGPIRSERAVRGSVARIMQWLTSRVKRKGVEERS